MKNFFRHPVIGIDRILSSGIKWQLLFLLGVIVAAILLFIVIEWLTGSILTIKENDPRNIFVDVYYHFADPGNQYVVEGTWNRFLAFLISITGSALMGGLLLHQQTYILLCLTNGLMQIIFSLQCQSRFFLTFR